MSDSAFRWVIAVVAGLGIVALLGYARGEPGDDGRVVNAKEINVVIVTED